MLSKIFSPQAKTPAGSARHRVAVQVSRVASMLTAVAMVATTLVIISAGLVATVDPAAATSGNAGTPQAPVSLFIEGFDHFPPAANGSGSASIQLDQYTGANGETYTAYAGWLNPTMCNGAVVSWNNVSTFMNACPSGGGVGGLVYALAGVAGKTGAAALDNRGVAAYTSGGAMPANSVQFETLNDITIAAQAGRFITFSVDAAEYSCGSAHARMNFFLLNNSVSPATATKVSNNPIDPCATTLRQPDNPNGSGEAAAGRFYGDAPMLFTGSSLGIRMENQEGGSAGNDAAFDNIQIQDVTPQLDQAFSPASVTMGSSSRMVYTVTNTTDLAAKTPFSFSANLPSGITVASVPNISSSCGGSLSANANASSLTFSGGGLTSGQVSCTVAVDVTPSAIGTYTSNTGNVQTTALNPPGSTTLTVTAPPVANITTTKILANIWGSNARAADSSSIVRSGDVLEYTFSAANSGGAGGSTTITDVVPANTTMSSSDWGCASGSVAGTSCSLTVYVPAGMTVVTSFVVRVNETIPAGATEIKNVATSSTCSATSCSPGANPLDAAIVSSVKSLYSVNGVAATASTPVKGGDVLVYQIIVTNGGGSGTTTTLSDVVPAATRYSGSGEGWSCAANSPAGTDCSTTVTVPSMGIPTRLTYTVTVATPVAVGVTQIKNTATGTSCSASNCSPAANPIPAAALSTTKTLATVNGAAATAATPVKAGDTLVYLLSTTNTGGASGTTTLNDSVPVATTYTGSGQGWSCATNSPAGTGCQITLTVTPGQTSLVYYTVKVLAPLAIGTTHISNVATGSSCLSTNCAPAANPVLAFRVKKTSDVSTVKAGGAIVYTIAVTNTGGSAYTAGTPASVSDSLTGVLDDAVLGATHTGLTLTGSTLAWSGALAVAQTLTFTYTLTVKAPDPGDHVLVNSLVTPIDGNCAAGSVEADCSVVALVQSFAASKTVSTTATKAGTSVTYTISVVNNGLVAYTTGSPARFTDDLSDVLDDATLTSNSSPGVTMSGSVLSWQGALPLSGTTIIQFTVLVTSGGTGNKILGNTAVTPTEGGCSLAQANPLCTVATKVQSFTTVKTANVSTVKAGGTVIYTIVVRNNGQVAYTSGDPAQFTDNLSAVLDDATVTVPAATGVTYTQPTISWQGALAIGATATVTYSATALNPGTGNKILTNRVLTAADGNCGAASTDPQCTTIVPVQALSVVKAASAATVKAGSSVNFTLTVKNTGQVAYTTGSPATFTDNLAAVLDDATVSVPPAAGVSYSAPTLSWQGALAIGATATISYTATATNPSSGNHLLSNTVVSPPEGTCAPGSPNALCTVVVGVQTYSVVKTANTVVGKANDTVVYTLVVRNTGSVNYTTGAPATFSDNLAKILDDATLLDHVGLTLTGQTLSWAGALNAGATQTFTYTVLVKNPVAAGDQMLSNTVVTPVESTCPASSTSALCTVVMPVHALSAVKTSNRGFREGW